MILRRPPCTLDNPGGAVILGTRRPEPGRHLAAGEARAPSRGSTSLFHASGWFAASYGFAIAGYLLTNAAASRLLGKNDFGYFALTTSAALILGQVGLAGWHRAGLREAATIDLGDQPGLDELQLGSRMVYSILLPAVAFVSGSISCALFVAQGRGVGVGFLFGVQVGLLVVANGHQKLWASFLRGFGFIRFASLLEGASGGALIGMLQSFLLVALVLVTRHASLQLVLTCMIASYLAPVIAAKRRVERLWGRPSRGPRAVGLRTLIARNWRVASAQVAAFTAVNVEVWIAGVVLSATQLSEYSAAQRLAFTVAIPLTVLQVVFTPALAREIARGSQSRLQELVRAGATSAAVLSGVFLVPVLIFPERTLTLVFGHGFGSGATILFILALGSVTNVLTGMCSALMVMAGSEGILARIQWLSIALRLVLGIVAAQLLGTVALAISAAAVSSLAWAWLAVYTYRRLGITTLPSLRPHLRLLRRLDG